MIKLFPKDKDKGDVNIFTLSVLLIGLFPGLGLVFLIGGDTFIKVDTVFNIALLTGAVAFLAHLPFLKRLNRFLAEMIGYCLFGWGLLTAALFLSVNYMVHSHPVVDVYPIKSFEFRP